MEPSNLIEPLRTIPTVQPICSDENTEAFSKLNPIYTESVVVRIYASLDITPGLSINWPSDYELAYAVLKNPAGTIVEKKSIMLSKLRASPVDAFGSNKHQEMLGAIELKESGPYQLYFEGISALDGQNGKFVSITTSFVVMGRNKATDAFTDVKTIVVCPSARHRPGRAGRGFLVERPIK